LLGLAAQAGRDEQRLEVGADDPAAADALRRDQACALENRDVLLDRREAHLVMAGQLEDALLGADRPADDVAACVIPEGGEHAVEVQRRDLHAYHRTVVSAGRQPSSPPARGNGLTTPSVRAPRGTS